MDYQRRGLARALRRSAPFGFLVLAGMTGGCSSDSDGAGDTTTDEMKATETPTPDRSPPRTEDRDPPAHEDPAAPQDLGLLGNIRARSYMDAFCEGKGDDALLPADPRELVQPGFNEGKAVAFNAYFQDCQGAPGPKTCGQYRTQAEAGRKLVQTDLAANFFGVAIPAALYNRAWRNWDGSGLKERPADFDEQARQRYGLPEAPFHNPYPLPGENPNETDGGSGKLPLGLTQLRGEDGRWTGTISMTCEICHSSSVQALGEGGGKAYLTGMGANTADMQLLLTDMAAPMPVGINDSVGVTNAMGLSALIIGVFDQDSLDIRMDTAVMLQIQGKTLASGDTKSPPWWNSSHRTRKFWDGGYSQRATRMDSAILNVPSAIESLLGRNEKFNHKLRDKVENDSLVIQTFIESLQSPVYPWEIDKALAEQGSVLFHSLDLWADGGNADIPRPPSNGSCAGCHGAYAPRYVNDPNFLEDPRLAGMAGYVTPIEIIRTDPERFRAVTPTLREMLSTGWLAYPESSPGYVAPEAKSAEEERKDDRGIFEPGTRPKGACTWQGTFEEEAKGYLAPPLHGIWASGPYLHNGSVPDVWGVLSPADRPAVWRRQLTTGKGSEHGLDTGASAYNTETLGWKYERLVCSADGAAKGKEKVNCEPTGATQDYEPIEDFVKNWSEPLGSLAYQVRQPVNRENVELRKIYNTQRFAKSNAGHDFTRVLTDVQRRAIIEYLKTL